MWAGSSVSFNENCHETLSYSFLLVNLQDCERQKQKFNESHVPPGLMLTATGHGITDYRTVEQANIKETSRGGGLHYLFL